MTPRYSRDCSLPSDSDIPFSRAASAASSSLLASRAEGVTTSLLGPKSTTIVAERGEAVRKREQVHLLAGGGVEVRRRDHLARGGNKLQELHARAAHQEESGGGGT